ncbi:MAG: DUF2062 domain-containing protein [Deltaproteobacteria bacterium]|nr:DUF2062 domain-containing protein [Deltaproteobacteria bacterium]
MKIKDPLKKFYHKFISLKGDPKPIALGMSLGVFIGVTPTIPFHTVLIILLGILFKQNITSACLGSWIISNPLTIPFFYVIEYELGEHLLGIHAVPLAFADYTLINIAKMGWQIVLPLLTGGIMLAPLFAIPAYFITHRLIVAVRNRRHHRHP